MVEICPRMTSGDPRDLTDYKKLNNDEDKHFEDTFVNIDHGKIKTYVFFQVEHAFF